MNKRQSQEEILKDFIDELEKEYGHESVQGIDNLIDLNRDKEWALRLCLLQWWFSDNNEKQITLSKVSKDACSFIDENGLIQRFSNSFSKLSATDRFNNIESKDFMKGVEHLKNQVPKLAEVKQIFIKQGNNYLITALGENLAIFLYFHLLIEEISLKKIVDLIEADFSEIIIKNLRLDPTHLQKLYVLTDTPPKAKKSKINYQPSSYFHKLIDFLRKYPILYPKELKLLKHNYFESLRNFIIYNEQYNALNLLRSNFKLQNYDKQQEKIDWIYELQPEIDDRPFYIIDWLAQFESNEIDSNWKLDKKSSSNIQILQAPGGYGKSIYLMQQSMNIIHNNLNFHERTTENKTKFEIVPLTFSTKLFNVKETEEKETLLYYDKIYIGNLSKNRSESNAENSQSALIVQNLLIAALWPYQLINANMAKLFYAALQNYIVLLILDGWDELNPEMGSNLKEFIELTLDNYSKFKIVISSRYIDNNLQLILSNYLQSSGDSEDDLYLSLPLPDKYQIDNFLKISLPSMNDLNKIELLKAKFNNQLSPLDLSLMVLFPNMELPQYRISLYDRWIYYQILSEYYPREELTKLENVKDLINIIQTKQIARNIDGKEYSISEFADGFIESYISTDNNNYALFKIIPQICYSLEDENLFAPYEYHLVIKNNPLLKRFIGPIYDNERLKEYCTLIDFHFSDYFIAKYIFEKFELGEYILPIPKQEIEDLLKELFEIQKIDSPTFRKKINEYEISNSKEFIGHLYLESKIMFPAQQIKEDTYEPGDGGFIDPGRYQTTSLEIPLYGSYLIKAFQFEYQKCKSACLSSEIKRLLSLYNILYEERPSIQRRLYITNEGELPFFPEPEINHSPLNYFELITQLFNMTEITPDSIEIIKYNKQQYEYYLPHEWSFLDHLCLTKNPSPNHFLEKENYSNKYWKTKDIQNALQLFLQKENIYIYPWLNEVLNILDSKLHPILDVSNLFGLLIDQNDQEIQFALFNIIIRQDLDFLTDRIVDINRLKNSGIISIYLKNFLKNIDNLPTKKEFSILIQLFQTGFIQISDRIKILKLLIRSELDSNQVQTLQEIYLSLDEQSKDNLIQKFAFNCLLLINCNTQPILSQPGLMIEYALASGNYFYFDLLEVINVNLSELLSNFKLFKYNEYGMLKIHHSDFAQNLSREDKEFDRALAVLTKPKQKNSVEFKSVNIFIGRLNHIINENANMDKAKEIKPIDLKTNMNQKNQKEIIDPKEIYNKLEQFFKRVESQEINPKSDTMDEISLLLSKWFTLYDNDPINCELWVEKIFNLLLNNRHLKIINSIKTFGTKFPIDHLRMDEVLGNFFEKHHTIDKQIRIKWLKILLESDLYYSEYRILFEELNDGEINILLPFIENKLKKEGDHFLNEFNIEFYETYKRRSDLKDIFLVKLEKTPLSLLQFIPPEILHQELEKLLDFNNEMQYFDRDFLNNSQFRQQYFKPSENWESNFDEESLDKSREDYRVHIFRKKLSAYVANLIEKINFQEKYNIIAQLWEKYWYYPLVYYRHHPSFVLCLLFPKEIYSKIYAYLNDDCSKIALILCYIHCYGIFEKRMDYGDNDFISPEGLFSPLRELELLDPKKIAETMVMLDKSDWFQAKTKYGSTNQRRKEFDILYFFTDLSSIPIDEIFNLIEANHYQIDNMQYFDIQKIFPAYQHVTPNILFRVNLFQYLAQIPKDQQYEYSNQLFEASDEDFSNVINFITQHNYIQEIFIPVFDLDKIHNQFESIWPNYLENLKEFDIDKQSSTFKKFIRELRISTLQQYIFRFFNNPLNYFLPNNFEVPLPEGINLNQNESLNNFGDEKEYPEENDQNFEDDSLDVLSAIKYTSIFKGARVLNQKDLRNFNQGFWQFDKDFITFIINSKDEVYNSIEFLDKLETIQDERQVNYLIENFAIEKDLDVPPNYLFEILVWILKILVNNPEKQEYSVDDMGFEFYNAKFKQCSSELHFLDKILAYGFDNACFEKWYNEILQNYGEDSEIFTFFCQNILNHIYFFKDLKVIPKNLRVSGLKLILYHLI